MSYATDLYQELLTVVPIDTGMDRRYQRMRRLMDRMLKERTQSDDVEYCGMMPRLYALERRYRALPLRPLCVLWSNALMVSRGELTPTEEDFRYDLKALCQGITVLYEEIPPRTIRDLLPEHWRSLERQMPEGPEIPQLRVLVTRWDETHIEAMAIEDGTQVTVNIDPAGPWAALPCQLYEGAQLNLLGLRGTQAELIVLDPDYLVDITTICGCLKSCGDTPMHYLMNKLMSGPSGLPLQLGNVANQFLDDLVNSDTQPGNQQYLESMQHSFRDYALKYCTLPVDRGFFDDCQQQYRNLAQVTQREFLQEGIDVQQHGIQLEPAFMSEALGLQGRLDLLTSDLTSIVELKSGKRDEFRDTYQREHAMQMALYKEILHRSLGRPRSDVRTLLLYSKYPRLYDIRLGNREIARAIALRNGIVHIDRTLRGPQVRDFLLSVTEADLNPNGKDDKFYTQYQQPHILHFLGLMQQASDLEMDYLCQMLAFTQREQFLAKVGDDRPDSDHGFAQTWLCSTREKLAAGNIIIDLSLTPIRDQQGIITALRADMLPGDEQDIQPNFREGDMVTLYERNSERDIITNRQILRCNIEEMHPDWLLLRLTNPQRNDLWLHDASLYAIEPAHMDATFTTQYRGLFSLLTALPDRRDLILGQRLPQTDTSISLTREIENEEVRNIILGAMQARDYYLLVGPPGTGKTSVALSNMVQELMLSRPQESILLMAYTNRAVDEICEMLERLPQTPDYVRLGQELHCGAAYRHRLMAQVTESCKKRGEISNRLAPVRVFCGTVSSLSSQTDLFRLRHFGTALLDEASQVLEPQMLPLLCQKHTLPDGREVNAIQRFIFIGDHKQLPAVVTQHPTQSAVHLPSLNEIGLTNCRDSLFERLHRLAMRHGQQHLVGMLQHQGRMHPAVSQYVCAHYYGGLLDTVPLPHQTEPLEWTNYNPDDKGETFLATHRTGFLDIAPTQHDENNKVNLREAQTVARMVASFHSLYQQNNLPWQPGKGIGIIVPFRGQITMLRRQMEALHIPDYQDITIDTVERYQGSQRDIIIFCTVIHQRYQLDILSAPVESDGQMIDRKLNVAITRARKQFFLVGNGNLLRQSPDYAGLIQQITQ